jgi:hypothetical protein
MLYSFLHLSLLRFPPSPQHGIAASDPGWVDGSVNALLQIARAEDAAVARETSTTEVTEYRRYFNTACSSLLSFIAYSAVYCCLERCSIVTTRDLSICLLGLPSCYYYCGDESYHALSTSLHYITLHCSLSSGRYGGGTVSSNSF